MLAHSFQDQPSDVAEKIYVFRSALTLLDLLPLPGWATAGGAGPDGGMAGGGCFSRASTSLFSCSAASERTPGCWSAPTLGATGCCDPAASLTDGAVAPPCSAQLTGAAAGCAVTSAIRVQNSSRSKLLYQTAADHYVSWRRRRMPYNVADDATDLQVQWAPPARCEEQLRSCSTALRLHDTL